MLVGLISHLKVSITCEWLIWEVYLHAAIDEKLYVTYNRLTAIGLSAERCISLQFCVSSRDRESILMSGVRKYLGRGK